MNKSMIIEETMFMDKAMIIEETMFMDKAMIMDKAMSMKEGMSIKQGMVMKSATKNWALIAIGNELRADDGIAQRLCSSISPQLSQHLHYYDLGLQTQQLSGCLRDHASAIIVDAVQSGQPPGSLLLIDLLEFIAGAEQVSVRSCHGISIIDELILLKMQGTLPKRLIFIGIEVASTDWQQKLSKVLSENFAGILSSFESELYLQIAGSSRTQT